MYTSINTYIIDYFCTKYNGKCSLILTQSHSIKLKNYRLSAALVGPCILIQLLLNSSVFNQFVGTSINVSPIAMICVIFTCWILAFYILYPGSRCENEKIFDRSHTIKFTVSHKGKSTILTGSSQVESHLIIRICVFMYFCLNRAYMYLRVLLTELIRHKTWSFQMP